MMRLAFNSLEGCKLKQASVIMRVLVKKHQSGGYIIYGHADMYIALILNLELAIHQHLNLQNQP